MAALCQIAYFVAMRSLYQCIFVTFSLSVCLIYALDSALRRRTPASVLMAAARHGRERGRQVELRVVQHALEPLLRAFEVLQSDVHSIHPREKFRLGFSDLTILRQNRKNKRRGAKCPRGGNFFAALFLPEKHSRVTCARRAADARASGILHRLEKCFAYLTYILKCEGFPCGRFFRGV